MATNSLLLNFTPYIILILRFCLLVLVFGYPKFSDPPTECFTYTNKKRHEVMCSCPSNLGIGKHLCRNGGYGEHISRLKVCFYPQAGCLRTMHTRQAKAYNAHPPAVILPISDQGQYRNAFLAYNFRSRKSVQKYKHFPIWQNKKAAAARKFLPRGGNVCVLLLWLGYFAVL